MKITQPEKKNDFIINPSNRLVMFYWGDNNVFYFKTKPPTGIIRTYSDKFIISFKTYTL